MPQLSHKTIKACPNISLQFKTIDWAKGWERLAFIPLVGTIQVKSIDLAFQIQQSWTLHK